MNLPAPDKGLSIEEVFRRRARESERQAREVRERMLTMALASIEENDRDPYAYITAARRAKELGRLRETLALLERGIAHCSPSPALHEYYIERLEKCNRTEEAIAVARKAALLFPDHLIFKLREALLLPIFYDTPEQLNHYRRRFAEGLRRIVVEIRLDTSANQQRALAALASNVNKYLGYQGQNDRDLQMQYGKWAHEVMAANFPQWAQPLPMPPVASDGQLKIGYVSARFRDMSVTKAFLGWLREHNRERIATFVYHVGQRTDAVTAQVTRACESFQQLPGSLGKAAQAILADNLHVLVFLDLGMEPLMTQLAALRLAPIQCVAWDHPVTSGLPTMDYFLSGELTEPDDAADHYSEELVRLPGIGLCYNKPVVPGGFLSKTRGDFGIGEDAAVYLSCQSIFKYLPDHDSLFAQIAARLPTSQFVFLFTNEIVRADFEKRLHRTFSAAGLPAAEHCVLLPEVSSLDYWNLCRNSDVVLDTIGWSGGVSTFEAITCGLPVVTLPGGLMRGRQSYAILTQLGVTETIARNEADYVDIAVRLGLDRQWRQDVIDRMVAGHPRLYGDARGVRALEDFYRRVVEERLRSQTG